MTPDQLLSKYPIISDQVDRAELLVILRELQKVQGAHIPGAVVEFGCYAGTTSLFIQRLLAGSCDFHVYDSFAGLPEKTAQDLSPAGEQFQVGELSVSKANFVHNFKRAGLPLPTIHKAWFNELEGGEVPAEIAFAFLDGDYYDSIRVSLKLIEHRLTPGAVVIIDDYANEALPGAARAADEWLRGKPHRLRVQSSLALISII